MSGFEVVLTETALDDLARLQDFLIARARHREDLALAESARDAVLEALALLARNPLLFRKLGHSSVLRELVVPFAAQGYVMLYEIVDAGRVEVLALRHQREDDYH